VQRHTEQNPNKRDALNEKNQAPVEGEGMSRLGSKQQSSLINVILASKHEHEAVSRMCENQKLFLFI